MVKHTVSKGVLAGLAVCTTVRCADALWAATGSITLPTAPADRRATLAPASDTLALFERFFNVASPLRLDRKILTPFARVWVVDTISH
jgi:hypothetical protein